jgi:hypothetical protein
MTNMKAFRTSSNSSARIAHVCTASAIASAKSRCLPLCAANPEHILSRPASLAAE